MTPPGQRIALARDAAFSFIYPHMLEGWRAAGAEIMPFSPLADEAPDDSADVCWLPGGYPELHAGQIAANSRFRSALRAFAQTRPVHGECGGYMVLGEGLTDAEGTRHEMTGLLGLETSFAKRRMHLGYRLAELTARHARPSRTARGCAAMNSIIPRSSRSPIRRSPPCAMPTALTSPRPVRGAGTSPARSSI